MERENVLDLYFNDITVEPIESEEKGWNMLHSTALEKKAMISAITEILEKEERKTVSNTS